MKKHDQYFRWYWIKRLCLFLHFDWWIDNVDRRSIIEDMILDSREKEKDEKN